MTYSEICAFHSIANVIYYLEPLSTESESFQSSVATKRLKGGHYSSLFWSIRRLRLFGFLQDHEFTSLLIERIHTSFLACQSDSTLSQCWLTNQRITNPPTSCKWSPSLRQSTSIQTNRIAAILSQKQPDLWCPMYIKYFS